MFTATILLSPFLIIFGTIFGIADRSLFTGIWCNKEEGIRVEFVDRRTAVFLLEDPDSDSVNIKLRGRYQKVSLRDLALRNFAYKVKKEDVITWNRPDFRDDMNVRIVMHYSKNKEEVSGRRRRTGDLEVRLKSLLLRTDDFSGKYRFGKNMMETIIFTRCECENLPETKNKKTENKKMEEIR